jgi:predicted nucleic acid-binding protein
VYLLDTKVIFELRKPRPHGAVLAWLQAVDNANLQLASVSLGEIQAGIEITREQDAAIALVHGLTVVTHRQGLRRFRCGTVQSLRVNPFEYKGP